MAIVCIAGMGPGIGKTAVTELLIGAFPGAVAARVRVGEEIAPDDAGLLAETGYHLTASSTSGGSESEVNRFLAAGAREVRVLLAEPRGLEAGLAAMLSNVPAGTHLVVEGNGYLWARSADAAVMVIGPGPSGKGLGRVQSSARELFEKITIWAWNTRRDPASEGFFEFPQALARMGFRETVSNRTDFHHVNPRKVRHGGNRAFLESVCQAIERAW